VSALAACCGALVGLGLTLLVASFVRREGPSFDRRRLERFSPKQWEHRTIRLALGLGAGVLLGGITGWPVLAVLGTLAGLGLPTLFAKSRVGADAIARVEAIAAWTEMLHDTLAGAAGLEQAILSSAPVAPEPIRTEIVTLAARLEHERPGPALRALADEMADPTMDLVVAALLLASEHQAARLGELLGRLAESARAQATMRLRVETGRARQRTSVKVAVGMTIGLGAFMTLLDRSYLAPFGSALGQFVLALIGACFTLAFVWLGRITRSGPAPRLLRTEARLGIRNAEARP
jgi:Flp pilus assembly protein TadB